MDEQEGRGSATEPRERITRGSAWPGAVQQGRGRLSLRSFYTIGQLGRRLQYRPNMQRGGGGPGEASGGFSSPLSALTLLLLLSGGLRAQTDTAA